MRHIFLLIATSLVAASAAGSGVTLTWNDNSTDETGFSVERSRDGVVFTEITTVPANTIAYTDSDLSTGSYWYRVRAFNGSTYSSYSGTVGVTIAALVPPTLPSISTQPLSVTVASGDSTSFSVVGSSTGALTYQWKKNGINIDGATSSSFIIASVKAQDVGDYTVAISSSTGSVVSQSATLTLVASASGSQLSGTVISSAPWNNIATYSGLKVFDNDTASFFSGRSTDSLVYVGLDFGSAQIIQSISYFPRSGFASRMNGGRFRGANRADLTDAVTLYTIDSIPVEGRWQTVTLPALAVAYQYVFYTTDPSNNGDVAEIKFYGTPALPKLTGTVISSAPWSDQAIYAGAKVFDNDTTSFFSGRSTDALVYVGLDLGSGQVVQSVAYFPRLGFSARMNGGRFRGANRADLADAVTLYTIPSTPAEGQWQTVAFPASTAGYRYVFFTTDSSNFGDVAEIKFYGVPATPTSTPVAYLTGTTISSNPWSNLPVYAGAKVFDGDTASFFSGQASDSLIYVGLDLGSTYAIDAISYYPRTGFSARMNGGKFCGANRADLSDSVVIYTIPTTPIEGKWTDVTLPTSTAGYRYVFYTTNSANYGDVAEIELFGKTATVLPAAPSGATIAGTVISSAAWNDISTYSGGKALDGDTTTFFAGKSWNTFVYVGQDFGAAKQVGVISFFPRTGFNYRMTGGRFCGANKSDLSDASVLYTITTTPTEGVWQNITLSAPSAGYRYVFYTTDPANGADIAELSFKSP